MFVFNVSSLSTSFVLDADLHIFKKRLRIGGGGKKNQQINLWDKRSKQRLRGNRDDDNNNSYNNSFNKSKDANEVEEKTRKRWREKGKGKKKREERRREKEEKEVVFMQLFEVAPTYMSAMEEILLPLGEIPQ